ncbi:hypothetical protein GQ600_20961 [Phytophthora cactorum]|nr:hypothetical protein GQ600_20961 [Phytophthora cactorum]
MICVSFLRWPPSLRQAPSRLRRAACSAIGACPAGPSIGRRRRLRAGMCTLHERGRGRHLRLPVQVIEELDDAISEFLHPHPITSRWFMITKWNWARWCPLRRW